MSTARKKTVTTPMRSKNVWGDRLQPPFKSSGDHIGVDLPGGSALFFTRRGGVSGEPFEELNVGLDTNDYMPAVEENRRRVAELIGIPQERWLESKQVHGSTVRVVTELPEPDAAPVEADGVATMLEDVAAVVVTADCLPVALIAPEGVAMIHAGWKGLAADVLRKGVLLMREAGVEGDIQAAIGPSIGVCCYEVNTHVHRSFMRYPRGVARLSNHAHLKNVARLQLQHAGIPLELVHDVDICTMCAPRSLFHSHRRDYGNDSKDTGRQASAVWRVPVGDGDQAD
ncbi:MAG TPA: polyphenol oxidase family protein [Solirubrobacteraceae bacterium]|nr:polyphenol oxidase family protein [Solirubrobacteraceae bacterium]